MEEPAGNESQQAEKPFIDDAVKENLKSRNTWLRFFYMLVFVLILTVAEIVLTVVVIFQFFTALFTGQRNEQLLNFAAELSSFVYDIWCYLSFVSDEQPFPFGEWKSLDEDEGDDSPGRDAD